MTTETITRAVSSPLEELLGKTFTVLDKGHIRVIDYMGTDESIVQAARVSYGKGTKTVSEDRGLIRYLMRHRHTTPFEMCELKLHVKIPMDHWRQWIRHRTASVNEYSTRYSEAIDERQQTPPGEWRFQSGANKQGSGDYLPPDVGANLSDGESIVHGQADNIYQQRLKCGVAREQARKDLPLSTYTEAYWKIDLHNLLHFLSLRMDPHAQKEIRAYATLLGEQVVAKWVPHTWEAFVDYRLESLVLSRLDRQALRLFVSASKEGKHISVDEFNSELEVIFPNKRERDEFTGKVDRLLHDTAEKKST